MTHVLVSKKSTKNIENQVKIWDLPVNMDEQDLVYMIQAKFREVKLYTYVWREVYILILIEFAEKV